MMVVRVAVPMRRMRMRAGAVIMIVIVPMAFVLRPMVVAMITAVRVGRLHQSASAGSAM
jgi:hypothetical protein